MATTDIPTAAGSQVAPSFEHATVRDAMRHGVITCPPETPLVTVARMMASHHVHAVVVTAPEAERDADPEVAWGIVSDRELLRAGGRAADLTAAGAAGTDFVRVGPAESLADASRRMLDHAATHAVVAAETGRPLGMLSSLDVAGVIAWGRA